MSACARPAGLLALALAAALAGPTPAASQSGDDRLRDQEEQDRRYLERLRATEAPADQPEGEEEDPRAAFLARADALIRDPNYRSWSTERQRVQTDDPRVDPRAAATLLDAFREFFDRFWQGRLALAPYDETSRAFLFWSYHKFDQLVGGDWRFRDQRPKGHYRPSVDAIVMHTDPDGTPALAEALVHEAAHQLVARRIYAGEAQPATWIAEGLASYFGYTRMDPAGGFLAGEVGRKSAALLRDARPERADEARLRLAEFLRERRKAGPEGVGGGVARVLHVDPAEFFGPDADRNYTASWLLVHYLLHGEDCGHAAAFAGYLERDAAGAGGTAILLAAIGLDEAALDAAVTAHAREIKVR